MKSWSEMADVGEDGVRNKDGGCPVENRGTKYL